MIPAKREFVRVFRQMLPADMMPRSDNTALEQREKRFGCVRGSDRAVSLYELIFVLGMVHRIMRFPMLQRVSIRSVFIRVHNCIFVYALIQGPTEILLRD